jgi:hypothetical protein
MVKDQHGRDTNFGEEHSQMTMQKAAGMIRGVR